MNRSPLTIEELRELINKGEAKDPLVFLEAVMNGQDPRRLSSIYDLVMEIDEFTGGDISKSDWNDILDHVMCRFKYQTVSLSESVSASKTIAEYLHAKRKQVETVDRNVGTNPNSNPLTEDEILIFKEKFNDEF